MHANSLFTKSNHDQIVDSGSTLRYITDYLHDNDNSLQYVSELSQYIVLIDLSSSGICFSSSLNDMYKGRITKCKFTSTTYLHQRAFPPMLVGIHTVISRVIDNEFRKNI